MDFQSQVFDESGLKEQELTLQMRQSGQITLAQSNSINTYRSHQHLFGIEVMEKIITRYFSRHFTKNLIFYYIRLLKQTKISEIKPITIRQEKINVNWPFKQLYFKKRRTTEQQQLFEFVNLCAQTIQSKFRSYVTRRRHQQALSKAKKAKDLLVSFVRRWKIYRTYNCEKIVEIRRKVRQIQKQIDIEEENYSNRDAKKLKGLYKYLQINSKMFKDTFNLLLETGMWTLQKNLKPRHQIIKSQPNAQAKQNSLGQYSEDVPAKVQRAQRQRVRQFRGAKRPAQRGTNQNVSLSMSEKGDIDKKQNIDKNIQKQQKSGFENKSSLLQDRPIKAAGQYKFAQFQQGQGEKEQKGLKVKEKEKEKNLSKQQKKQDKGEEEQTQKGKEKSKKAQQLQKRTKYDPRKAIQEEKKRKKQQAQKRDETQPALREVEIAKDSKISIENEIAVLPNTSKSVNKKKGTERPKQQDHQSTPNGQKKKGKKTELKEKEKDKKNGKNENQQEKSQLNLKKVTSKVDCWVNKKQPEPQWVKQYKSRILQGRQQENQRIITEEFRKSIQKFGINISSQKNEDKTPIIRIQQLKNQQIEREREKDKIRERERQIERDRQHENQKDMERRFIAQNEQRKRVILQNWKNRSQQIDILKQKQSQFAGNRKNSGQNLQQQVRAIIEKKNSIKRKQAHRAIEELQQTYNKHYGDRYQNLMPKLSLLAVARKQQKKSQIPVLEENDQQFNEWFENLYNSSQYWKVVTYHDRTFKTFINS